MVAPDAGGRPPGLAGTRDCALLLTGFAGALRRSEIVALRGEDRTEVDEGLVVTLTRSKGDQEGAGRPSPSTATAASTLATEVSFRRWPSTAW
jgi:integrase